MKGLFLFIAFLISVNPILAEEMVSQADKSVVFIVVKLPKGMATGTGVVVAPEIVATNHHVIEDALKIVAVSPSKTADPKPYLAQVIWDSPNADLALLRVVGLPAPAATIGSAPPAKGSQVIAIGYPAAADDVINYEGLESTITQGIVGRVLDGSGLMKGGAQVNFIQHSAPINHGNSGGPLLDLCGRVVGINEAKPKSTLQRNKSGGVSVDQTDGIFIALGMPSLMYGMRSNGINFVSETNDCIQSQSSGSPKEPKGNSWILPVGIFGALILAGGALFFSLRKNKTIVETYTQFKKRSDSNSPKAEMHHASIPSLILRGYDTKGNKVKLVINSQTLSGGKANIGRDKHSCSFSIDDQTVSRIHACLELIAGRLTIKDLGSTNGTSVNGVPVGSQPVRIHPGQKLSIGKVILTLDGEIS